VYIAHNQNVHAKPAWANGKSHSSALRIEEHTQITSIDNNEIAINCPSKYTLATISFLVTLNNDITIEYYLKILSISIWHQYIHMCPRASWYQQKNFSNVTYENSKNLERKNLLDFALVWNSCVGPLFHHKKESFLMIFWCKLKLCLAWGNEPNHVLVFWWVIILHFWKRMFC
jgi:hypothetical protein